VTGLDLNPEQQHAVQYGTGPLLVLAGAGSGKTRVLTARVSRLIQEDGERPERILAVTFTNKAAGVMRERIADLLGEEPRGLWVGTFHSIAARLLRREGDRLTRGANQECTGIGRRVRRIGIRSCGQGNDQDLSGLRADPGPVERLRL